MPVGLAQLAVVYCAVMVALVVYALLTREQVFVESVGGGAIDAVENSGVTNCDGIKCEKDSKFVDMAVDAAGDAIGNVLAKKFLELAAVGHKIAKITMIAQYQKSTGQEITGKLDDKPSPKVAAMTDEQKNDAIVRYIKTGSAHEPQYDPATAPPTKPPSVSFVETWGPNEQDFTYRGLSHAFEPTNEEVSYTSKYCELNWANNTVQVFVANLQVAPVLSMKNEMDNKAFLLTSYELGLLNSASNYGNSMVVQMAMTRPPDKRKEFYDMLKLTPTQLMNVAPTLTDPNVSTQGPVQFSFNRGLVVSKVLFSCNQPKGLITATIAVNIHCALICSIGSGKLSLPPFIPVMTAIKQEVLGWKLSRHKNWPPVPESEYTKLKSKIEEACEIVYKQEKTQLDNANKAAADKAAADARRAEEMRKAFQTIREANKRPGWN